MNVVPSTLDGVFSYKDPSSRYYFEGSIEVQVEVDILNGNHIWYIFFHSVSPPELKRSTYKSFTNRHLYDCIVELIVEFDAMWKTDYYKNCILKGDWFRGNVHPNIPNLSSPDKRAWYKRMFDAATLDQLFKDLTDAQRRKAIKYV